MEKRLYELTNGEITIAVSNCGAELHSVQKDGAEYLWQAGVLGLWKRHSPVLLPFVGRFTDGKYKLHGKEYPMTIHGFCQEAMFDMVPREENRLVFELTDTDETYAVYPFHFEFRVAYELTGSSIAITYRVQNFSEEVMYFGLGAHPGFKVPLEEGLAFEDYYLEFKDVCEPDRVIFSANALGTHPVRIIRLREEGEFRFTTICLTMMRWCWSIWEMRCGLLRIAEREALPSASRRCLIWACGTR